MSIVMQGIGIDEGIVSLWGFGLSSFIVGLISPRQFVFILNVYSSVSTYVQVAE